MEMEIPGDISQVEPREHELPVPSAAPSHFSAPSAM